MLRHIAASAKVEEPLCSICIANYNGAETLDKCLDSILKQDCNFEVEIIVHDDASTDHSIDDIQDKYPNVELLISQENVGFCISNNRMAEIARGKFLLLLNNDATLLPNALRELETHARLQMPPGILGLAQYDMASERLIDRGSMFDLFLNPIPNLDVSQKDVGMVIGACLWIPKDLWNRIGGFPDWFGSMAEDMLICCIARLMNIPVQVLPDSGFMHEVGHSFGGGKVIDSKLITTIKRRSLSERNKIFVMIICFPGLWLLFCLSMHYVLLAFEGLFLSIYKRNPKLWSQVYWRALIAPLHFRKQLIHERKRVQKLRKSTLKAFLSPQIRWFHKLYMLRRFGVPHVD